jgi:hypothetical protein
MCLLYTIQTYTHVGVNPLNVRTPKPLPFVAASKPKGGRLSKRGGGGRKGGTAASSEDLEFQTLEDSDSEEVRVS